MVQLNDLSRRCIRITGPIWLQKLIDWFLSKDQYEEDIPSRQLRWYKLGLSAISGRRVSNYLYSCNDFSLKNRIRNGSKVKIGYFSFIAALVYIVG